MHEADAGTGGWVSYASGPGGKDHLTPDARAAVERYESDLAARRGRLLCEVQVQVFEHDAGEGAMWVVFPEGAVLGPDSDPAQIAAAVARAREALASWR